MKLADYERWSNMDAVDALIDYAGAREITARDSYYVRELVDEAGRVLYRIDALSGESWVIPTPPILFDFAERGLYD